MENKNGDPLNPVQNFLYSLILRRFTYPIVQTLSRYYYTMGGVAADLCAWPPPIDDPAPPEQYVEGDAITLDAQGFSCLFLYHFLDSCTLPEMTSEEVAWVSPSLEAFFAEEYRTLYFDVPKLAYLLWLYERKRLPLKLHERLLHHMVQTYQAAESNDLLWIPDPAKAIALWNDAFGELVKLNLPAAREKEEAQRIKWEEDQLRLHAEAKEAEARRLAEYEKRRGEEELDRVAGAFAADLVTRYAANPAAFAHRFSLPADHPEVLEVITGYNLRGVLDDQGTLWVSGRGRLTRRFLSQLSEEGFETLLTCILDEGIVHLDDGAFFREETVNLAAIHLPNSLKSIRKQAFQYCTKLFRISLPRGLRYVGPMAFMGCKSLTELVLPVFTETFSASALEGTGLSMPPTIPGLCRLVRQPEPVRNYDGVVLFPGSRISFRS